jgi:hypothetical protein
LPDGLFSNQKSKFGKFLEGLAMEDVGILYDTWSILWSFVIFYGHLVQFLVIWYIFPLWYFFPRKIWQPWCELVLKKMACVRSEMFTPTFVCKVDPMLKKWPLACRNVQYQQNVSLGNLGLPT